MKKLIILALICVACDKANKSPAKVAADPEPSASVTPTSNPTPTCVIAPAAFVGSFAITNWQFTDDTISISFIRHDCPETSGSNVYMVNDLHLAFDTLIPTQLPATFTVQSNEAQKIAKDAILGPHKDFLFSLRNNDSVLRMVGTGIPGEVLFRRL